jgi:hypothetical protein
MNDEEMYLIFTKVRIAFPDDPDLTSPAPVRGLPEDVAAWLATNLPPLRTQIPHAAFEEAAGVALAGLYGPRNTGLIPAQDLADLLAASRFTHLGDARAVERAVVYAARLRGRRGWAAPWPGAVNAIFRMVRIQVPAPLQWIYDNLGRPPASPRSWRLAREIDFCAAVVSGALISGRCFCSERCNDFLQSDYQDRGNDLHIPPLTAASDCATHSFSCWDQQQPLGLFIWENAVREHLGATPSGPQEFRRGMLAKLAVDGSLAAGETMRCRQFLGIPAQGSEPAQGLALTCYGEVEAHDRCEHGHFPCRIKDLTWRLWYVGQRGQVPIRRCSSCNYFYFQFNKRSCPFCDANAWSRRPGRAYVPVRRAWLTSAEISHRLPTDTGLTPERSAELQDAIEQRLSEPHRTFAKRFLLNDRKTDIDAIAEAMNLDTRARRQSVEEVFARLADLLPQPPELAQENEPEVNP